MNFDKVFDDIKEGVGELVKNAAQAYADDAKSDLRAFLDDTKDDLKRYTKQLVSGDLKKIEYEFLVGVKASNAKLLALSAKGIAKSRLKHLRDSVKDLILNTVFAAI